MKADWAALLCGLAALPAIGAGTAGAGTAAQTASPREIAVGDPLRKPLLDGLRPTIERDLGQPVKFVVRSLRTMDGWAFAEVTPQTPAGRPIDLGRTRYAEAAREGMMDGDTVHALLHRERGTWVVKAFAIGPTDVAWDGWDTEFGAPRALLFPQ